MKSAILFLVAIGIGLVAGADLQSSATAIANAALRFSPAASRVTKQENTCTTAEVDEISNNYPTSCRAAANRIDFEAVSNFEPDAVKSFGDIFCKPECGNPILVYFRRCFGIAGQYRAEFLIQLCAQNSDGVRCISSGVLPDVLGTNLACSKLSTSSDCCQFMESTIARVGCCVNLLNFGGAYNFTGLVDDFCSNINDVPGDCGGSTLSGAVAPTIGTLFGSVAVLVVIMLQSLF